MRHALGYGRLRPGVPPVRVDGRNDAGQIVPDGLYHVQLQLKDEDRTIEFPSTVRVDSTPPTIQRDDPARASFSPDGDQRADRDRRPLHVQTSRPTRSSTSTAKRVASGAIGRRRSSTIRGTGAASGPATTAWRSPRKISRATSPGRRERSPSGSVTSTSSSTSSRLAAGSCASGSRPTRRPSAGGSGATRGNAKPPLIRLPVPSKPGRVHADRDATATARGQPSWSASSAANLPDLAARRIARTRGHRLRRTGSRRRRGAGDCLRADAGSHRRVPVAPARSVAARARHGDWPRRLGLAREAAEDGRRLSDRRVFEHASHEQREEDEAVREA